MFEQEIKTRQVVPILKGHWGKAIPVWLYYSSRQFLPVRIRLLIDYLVAEVSQQ
ncbi:hypothetical protein C9I98_01490 [Photobacterium sanctipauli]|uniref:LysR substrate-binding domain-containing protein n=1 Tax=Photobacterium sanctipauli TaxID=1342794 RepID=A0A2T3P0B0_9GAMM|nr:hypothetical protein C9I98_01490 [Photobacterium sanctipauli]